MKQYNPMITILWATVAILLANQWVIFHYSPSVSGNWLIPLWVGAAVVGGLFGHLTEKYDFFQPMFEALPGGSRK